MKISTVTKVAVLGTGRMGGTIARTLAAAGCDVTVWNRTRPVAEALALGHVADAPAAAAAHARFVISSLTGPDALRAVYLGSGGAIEAAHGQVFIDMSTAGAGVEAELEAALSAKGSAFLSVPILGAPTLVAKDAATLLVGGDRTAFDEARELLEHLGQVKWVGGVSDAPLLKLIANNLLAIETAAAAEVLAEGSAAGLAREDVFWVVTRLLPNLEPRHDGFVRGGQQPTLFALRDLLKDLKLAAAAFQHPHDLPSVTSAARGLIEAAASRMPGEDIAAVVRLYGDPPNN